MIYQIQQTSSECPQCSRLKHRNGNITSSGDSSQGSIQQNQTNRYVIPIKKNVMKNNQYVEQTLNLLQNQVQKLKKQNFLKQRKIRKLEAELTKKQYRIYPQNAKVGSIYQNQLQGYRKTVNSKRNYTENDHQQQSVIQKNQRKPKQAQSRALIQIEQIQKKIKQITQNKNERIHFLQEQLNRVQYDLKQYQEKLQQQINDNQWLTKFCLTFINMAGQVSKIQGKQIIEPQASLRKNTKIAWRYFKAFIKQVIQ